MTNKPKRPQRIAHKGKAGTAKAQDLMLELACYGLTLKPDCKGKGIRIDGPAELQARFFTRITTLVPELRYLIRQAEKLEAKRKTYEVAAAESLKPENPNRTYVEYVCSPNNDADDYLVVNCDCSPGPLYCLADKDVAHKLAAEHVCGIVYHDLRTKCSEPNLPDRCKPPDPLPPPISLFGEKQEDLDGELLSDCQKTVIGLSNKPITYHSISEEQVNPISRRFNIGDIVYCAHPKTEERIRCTANGRRITKYQRRGTSANGHWFAELDGSVEPHAAFLLRLYGECNRLASEKPEPLNNKQPPSEAQVAKLRSLGVTDIPKTKVKASAKIDELLRRIAA